MHQATVNGELRLMWPDGFEVMSADELKRLYGGDEPGRWGIWDRERHVIITVLWQDYNPILAWLADMKALARRNEQLTRRGYEGHDYRPGGFCSRRVAGGAAEGYRFTYRLGDVTQGVETVLIKRKRRVYSLSCIGRQGDAAANGALFDGVLSAAGFC